MFPVDRQFSLTSPLTLTLTLYSVALRRQISTGAALHADARRRGGETDRPGVGLHQSGADGLKFRYGIPASFDAARSGHSVTLARNDHVVDQRLFWQNIIHKTGLCTWFKRDRLQTVAAIWEIRK